MPSDCFDHDQIAVLFKAEECVLTHLAHSYEITSEVKNKTAQIVINVGRKLLMANATFDVEAIAMDALFVLMAVNSPMRKDVDINLSGNPPLQG